MGRARDFPHHWFSYSAFWFESCHPNRRSLLSQLVFLFMAKILCCRLSIMPKLVSELIQVVKVIWHKAALPPLHSANQNAKTTHDLDQFSHICTAHRSVCEHAGHMLSTNKSSPVAEMGDRGHNRHGPERGACCAPFSERWKPV